MYEPFINFWKAVQTANWPVIFDFSSFSFPFVNWTNRDYFCWVRKGISFKATINYLSHLRVDNIRQYLDNFRRNFVWSRSFSRIYISQNFIYLLNFRFFILNSFFTGKVSCIAFILGIFLYFSIIRFCY